MTREINIRLNANCAKAVHTGHKFVSGDKGIVFRIAVESMDTVGTTAKIVFKRSNGTSVEADITEENGIYCYTTLGNEFAVVGPVTADVKFYEGEKRLSTCTFVFDVISDTMDGIGAGTGGYSDTLERMKESMEQTESEMLEVKRDMEAYAEAFLGAYPFNPCGAYSETESYTVRDMVTHNDVAWVCYKDCTGATPAMDSDCWMPLAIKVVDAETLDGHGAEYFAPLSDLANYFKNTGGTVNGNVILKGDDETDRYLQMSNNKRLLQQILYKTGTYVFYDYTNGKTVFSSAADGANTFNGSSTENLGINAYNSVVKNGELLAELCIFGKEILHTGNKPTGTYTGNGDATQRVINTGGIGSACLVWSNNGTALVSFAGSLLYASSGVSAIGGEGAFRNNNILLYTTDNKLNADGVTYYYQVL